jgi:phospholipase/carboxylesterase
MSEGLDLLPHRVRPAEGHAAGALVLLHGRGTSEHDLFPLLDALDPDRRLVGVTPRGPLSLPPGGAHWYVVRRIGYPDRDTFLPALDLLARWLDATLAAFDIPLGHTVIGGFSQGAVMTHSLALGRGRPAPAGIVALSGFMPVVEGFELDLSGREGFRAALGHGTHDPVISAEFGRDARRRLEEAGADVLWRESRMDHSVDPAFMAELQPWLRATVDRAARG